MLKVPVPSNTSDTSVDVGGSGESENNKKGKKRRWSVCKAKIKAGVLKVRALVDSESSESGSDSSDSGSGSSSGGDGQSGSGADSGFGAARRPFPLEVCTYLHGGSVPCVEPELKRPILLFFCLTALTTLTTLTALTALAAREPCARLWHVVWFQNRNGCTECMNPYNCPRIIAAVDRLDGQLTRLAERSPPCRTART